MRGDDYHVEVSGLEGARGDLAGPSDGDAGQDAIGVGRPWLAISWRCCDVYSRVYRNRAGTHYEGNCPRCAKPVRVRIGPSGTHVRFFDAW